MRKIDIMSERDFGRLHASLQKAAAKGWQALQSEVSLRYASCQRELDNTYPSATRSTVMLQVANTHVDKIAEVLYPEDGLVDFYPVKVYGDGNCFYRSLSKAILGYEEEHNVMTVLELVKNIRKYASQATYDNMCSHPTNIQYVVETSVSDRSLVSGNFLKSIQNETLDFIKSGDYCSFIHFFAAVNSLNRPIYSIYSKVQNAAVNRQFLHQKLKPFSDDKVHPGSSFIHHVVTPLGWPLSLWQAP